MTMLANRTETRALTLADYEARIHLYKEQIGTGYIGIGRTLIEAKEAKVVPHGQWESWVTETTGLTPRQAQRCMQAATEIKDGSAMARLEMSKALLLLGSGLDEETREELAGKAADEGATVKDLREQLKQTKLKLVQETGAATEITAALRKAEAERDEIERQMKAQITAYKEEKTAGQMKAYEMGRRDAQQDAQKEKQVLQNELNGQRQYNAELLKELEAGRVPADYEQLKRDREDLLQAAEDAERRAADAEAELEALRAGGAGQEDPVWKVLKVAVTRFMADCEMMPLDPSAMVPEKARILANVTRIEKWTDMMRMALEGVLPGEGAVE